jgi:hypothetical protein
MKREYTAVFFVYAILTVIFTYPLVVNMNSAVPTGNYLYYDAFLNIWILEWDFHSLFNDPLNFYNANIFFPAKNTLVYSEHMLGNALTVMSLRIFTRNPIFLYNFLFLLTFVISGFGVYLLAKEIIGDKVSSFIAGIFFSFTALRFRYVYLLQILSCHWVPFALLFYIRFIYNKRQKDVILFFFFLFLSSISSIYITTMFVLILLFFSFFLMIQKKDYFDYHFFKKILPPFLITSIIVFVIHLPYLNALLSGFYTLHPEREAEVISNSANIASYVQFQGHSFLWSRVLEGFSSISGLSAGVILFLAGMIGIWVILNDRKDKFFNILLSMVFCVFISILFSLGPKFFLYRLFLHIFPLLKGIRVPERFCLFYVFFLSIVAAKGISMIGMKKSISFLIALLFVVENAGMPLKTTIVSEILNPESVYEWLKGVDLGDENGVVEIPFRRNDEEMWLEVKYTISSTIHWKKIVNGYSGYISQEYKMIRKSVFEGFPKRETLLLLKNSGVKLIIIHTEFLDKRVWEVLERYIEESPLIFIKNFGNDRVYEIPDDIM